MSGSPITALTVRQDNPNTLLVAAGMDLFQFTGDNWQTFYHFQGNGHTDSVQANGDNIIAAVNDGSRVAFSRPSIMVIAGTK